MGVDHDNDDKPAYRFIGVWQPFSFERYACLRTRDGVT